MKSILTLLLSLISLPSLSLLGMGIDNPASSSAYFSRTSSAAAAADISKDSNLCRQKASLTPYSDRTLNECEELIENLHRNHTSLFSIMPRDICNLVVKNLQSDRIWNECEKLKQKISNSSKKTIPKFTGNSLEDLNRYFTNLIAMGCELFGQNELMQDAAFDDLEAVLTNLLSTSCNIDVNHQCALRKTPLLIASKWNNQAVVRLLLTIHTIDVNRPDNHGDTPLHCATREGHEAVVRLLLTIHTIDVNRPNNHGDTPLHCATREGHEAVVRLLLSHPNIKINQPNKEGRIPLFYAVHNSYLEYQHQYPIDLSKLLVDNGACIKTAERNINDALKRRNLTEVLQLNKAQEHLKTIKEENNLHREKTQEEKNDDLSYNSCSIM